MWIMSTITNANTSTGSYFNFGDTYHDNLHQLATVTTKL